MSKINRAGCSKMLLPQSLPRSTRILWFKYCLQSRQFYEGSNDCFFSLLVLLIFTPSNFLSFLFGSIMFRHIYGFWLPFSVAKISDTFEQHHPNPKWWHRQIPCPVHEDNPVHIFLLFFSKNPNRSYEMSSLWVCPQRLPPPTFGVDISKEKALTSNDRLKVPQWTPREKLDLISSWMSTASSGFTCWNCINPLGYKWREISTHICN